MTAKVIDLAEYRQRKKDEAAGDRPKVVRPDEVMQALTPTHFDLFPGMGLGLSGFVPGRKKDRDDEENPK